MKTYNLQNLINECIMIDQSNNFELFDTDLLEAQKELDELKKQ